MAQVPYLTSTTALELEELPKSLLVLGGGYVGVELAQTLARAGVKVTLVCRSRLLPEAESEIGAALEGYLAAEDISIGRTHLASEETLRFLPSVGSSDIGSTPPTGQPSFRSAKPISRLRDVTKSYDLIVIGSGTAAMVAANRMAAAGKKVAVTDYRPFGGTCALRGCDPKKMLITGAQVMDDIRRMRGRGIAADGARIEWRDLMEFKRTFTGPVPGKQQKNYAAKGVDTYREHARFVGPNSLELERSGVIDATNILIAAGARPVPLGFPGEEHLMDNEGFLELDELPARIVMVGGGYIASEFSHIAARAGANVTVLQRGQRILPHFDGDLVGWLMEAFDAAGIDVRTRHSVEAVEKIDQGYILRVRTADGGIAAVDADLVVHAAGRIPDLDSLSLDAAGIERDQRGRLKLNDHLQSVSNPAVYAAGDAAAQGPPLTPVSSHDAKVVVGLDRHCQAEVQLLDDRQVALRRLQHWIDKDAFSGFLAPDEVRIGGGLGFIELAEEHGWRSPDPCYAEAIFGRRGAFPVAALSEILEDWAIGPIVVGAVLSEVLQRGDHRLHLRYFGAELLDMLHGEYLDVVACPLSVVPEGQEIFDLCHGEAEVACATDELERVNVALGVDAVARCGSIGGFDEAGPLIVADHLR